MPFSFAPHFLKPDCAENQSECIMVGGYLGVKNAFLVVSYPFTESQKKGRKRKSAASDKGFAY